MENASKALIIAGSILLSILIIALGMYIFSSSSGVTDDTTLSQMEVSTFNGKFDKYKGMQNGTNVSALLDALIANCNGTESDSELPVVTYVSENSSNNKTQVYKKSDFKTIKNSLESSHRYYVAMDTNDTSDLIHGICIYYDASKKTEAQKAATEAAALTQKPTTTTTTTTP